MKVKLLIPLFALLFSISAFAQIFNQPNDMFVCDDTATETGSFDLESQTPQILGELDPNNYTVTYHPTQADADNQLNPLVSPYTNVLNPQVIYASVIENATGNLEIFTFLLIVNTVPTNSFSQDVLGCNEGGGYATFDLSLFDFEFTGGIPDLFVTYYESFQDAEFDLNPIANPSFYYNIVPYFQTIYVRVENAITGCYNVSDNTVLYLNVTEEIVLNQPTPYVVCDDDDDGSAVFNLDTKTPEILGGNQNPTLSVTYHESQADAENYVNPLVNFYTNISNPQTLYVRVGDFNFNCYQTTTLELVVETNCLSAQSVEVLVCGEDPNIPVEYDLTSQETNMVNGQNPTDFTFGYYYTLTNAETETDAIANPEVYSVSGNSSVVYVRIEDNQSGDFAIVEIYLNFYLNPQIDFNGPFTICSGNSVVLYPFINNDNGAYEYLWSTGETSPEIVVTVGGTFTVTVTDLISGCVSTASVDVIEGGNAPVLADATDLFSCEPNATFDLTATLPEILNGQDASQYVIGYFNTYNSAYTNTNPITNPNDYVAANGNETIFVRVQNIGDDCFSITNFNITNDNSCPTVIDCGQEVETFSFCYVANDTSVYRYESSDGSPLQIFIVYGDVENNFDELVILDSDGVTNLNPEETTYGNDGDLTGLSFMSTGSSISISVTSDGSVSCDNQNYSAINYEVSCVDFDAIPNCNVTLTQPLDGDVDVDENTALTWSAPSGIVTGYKLSLGLTSGGTEVLDNVDVGNVLTYDLETLDFEVTYYLTIVPYNTNGDAEGCTEKSFTVRANPFQTLVCDDGLLNTIYCYDNDDVTEYSYASSDGLPLTIYFNSGSTEVDYDEVYITDSDGTILNPDSLYGNDGDFTGMSYTSSGSTISLRFDSDFTISCAAGSNCCTAPFNFDVFCTSSVGIIEVNAFIDDNANNIFDANEFNFSNGYFTYEANGDGMINTVNSSTGSFQIISENDTDVYEITFNLYEESAGCYDITTAVFDNISVAEGSAITVDFPVVEEQSCEDLAVYLINYWTPPRPGFTHENYLVLENLGFTTISSGTVEFTHDPLLVYNGVTSVNPNYTITATSTGFTVDFVNLQPGDVEYIDVSLTCPASVELGDILTNTANYVTDTNDLVPSNNFSTLSELVVGSWDPNDKMESHGPRVKYDDFVISDQWLYYTIRFQNLGTAAAEFIRIEDALDNQLNKASFQMLRSSHDYVVTRTDNDLEWFFEDINLPAEQDDAEGSNGYVYFRIQPNAGYALGDIIPNTAAIYFDFNAPVITNRFETEFVEDALSISEFDVNGFNMYPNPAKDVLTVKLNNITNANLSIYDMQGKLVIERSISDAQNLELNVSDLQSGLYFVKLNTASKEMVRKLIIE